MIKLRTCLDCLNVLYKLVKDNKFRLLNVSIKMLSSVKFVWSNLLDCTCSNTWDWFCKIDEKKFISFL